MEGNIPDVSFPIGKESLCKYIPKKKYRDVFLYRQKSTISDTFHERHHHRFEDGSLLFENIKALGVREYGTFWHVKETRQDRHMVQKVLLRIFDRQVDKRMADTSELGLDILHCTLNYRHRHLASLIGNYTDVDRFAILLEPVVDMNLKHT